MQRRLNIAVGSVTAVVLASGTIQAGSFFFASEVATTNDQLVVAFGPNHPGRNKPVDGLKQDSSGSGANLVKTNQKLLQANRLQHLLQIFEMAEHYQITAATFLSCSPEEYRPGEVSIRDEIAGTAGESRFTVIEKDNEATCRAVLGCTGHEKLNQSGHAVSTSTVLDVFVSPRTPDKPMVLLSDPSTIGYEKMTRRNERDPRLLLSKF